MANIRHVFDFNKALAEGGHAWPGGYPRYFVAAIVNIGL